MSKSKKKKALKHKKRFPPLSKKDRFLYDCIEVIGGIFLLVFVLLVEALTSCIVFNTTDALAYEQRLTVLLIVPSILFLLYMLLKITCNKIPITGNKKIDYLKTSEYKFILPLFDNRYKDNEKYKQRRKEFLKKSIIYFCVFLVFLTIGCMGCVGRYEFNEYGITAYSILNKKTSEYSYDEVDSYSVSAVTHFGTRPKGLSYRSYDIHLTVIMKTGDSFTASYDTARDVYALEKINNLLKGKNKTVNSDYLREFTDKHELSDDEVKVLYNLFEE